MEQEHNEQHLAKAQLARSLSLAPRWNQTMTFPIFKDLRKIIRTENRDTVDQGNRVSEAFDECAQEVVAPACFLELHAV